MQTLQQKREYTVAVLDPAGNVTAIVCSDVPAAERARVAAQILRLPELGIEQVAFLTAPRSGGEIRLEMMGGEFCGNGFGKRDNGIAELDDESVVLFLEFGVDHVVLRYAHDCEFGLVIEEV